MRFLRIIGIAAALSAGAAGFAAAQDANPAVKARQSLMSLYGHYIGQLGAMAKGAAPYDEQKAAAAARSLAALAAVDQSAMWPQGTSTDELGEATRALPAIWSTYPAISEKGQAFRDATAQMADAAEFGLDSLRGAMGPLGGACGDCHKAFRQPR